MDEHDEILREKVQKIYTPLYIAEREIRRRWNDQELKKKVENFLGGSVPDLFQSEPRAVISKHLLSPNIEFEYFFNLAKEIKLKPLGLEGISDKLCTTNPEKAALGKMTFLDKNGGENYDIKKGTCKIVDLKKYEGEKICEVKTLWNEKLVDFHHRLLDTFYPKIERFDDFSWFMDRGFSIKPKEYYRNYLMFFLCFGVLFENFSLYKNERKFTHDIVLPIFLEIEKEFGLKPLIVQLNFAEDESSFFWKSYSYALKKYVEA